MENIAELANVASTNQFAIIRTVSDKFTSILMHILDLKTGGIDLKDASKALIMLHGRGAGAEHILSLQQHLKVQDYALIAPQASNHTWYPKSFIEDSEKNEPWLSSAIDVVDQTKKYVNEAGIPNEHIYFLGFSQGACLVLEYVARNADKYGGVVAFTGGLIGKKLNMANYKGDFRETPVFIGTSDPDFHVPVERVYETTNVLKNMHADVTEKIYPNIGHTITHEEFEAVNRLIFGKP